MDLALNNLQRLICPKAKPTKPINDIMMVMVTDLFILCVYLSSNV